MSTYYYLLIPNAPDYVPDAAAGERALERFASFLPEAEEVTAEEGEDVEFVWAGENFETVSCPACGTVLENDWWIRAVDAAYGGSRFADLRVTTPCCGASTSLNDLQYYFPQGFARFVLSALEPHITDLEDWQVRELEEIVGCKLRKIWVHT
jgi:hypothetical protein